MIWILYIFLILTGFVICLLIPRVYASVEYNHKRSNIRISWLWMFLEYDFRTENIRRRVFFRELSTPGQDTGQRANSDPEELILKISTPPPHRPPREDKTKSRQRESTSRSRESSRKKKKQGRKFDFKSLWRERKLLKLLKNRLVRFLKRVFRTFQFDRMQCGLVLATDDASLTGWLYGVYCAVKPAVPRSVSVYVIPDFNRTKPEIDFILVMSFRPLSLIFNVFYGLLSLPWIRIYRARSSFLSH